MPTKRRKSKTVNQQRITVMPNAKEVAERRAAALAEAERLEKLAPHERIMEAAKARDRVTADMMRVSFPSLRAIKHIKGVIMVVADPTESMKQAIVEAENILGPKAPHDEIMKLAERRRNKTTLMSVNTFKRNLMNTLMLCNGHAEMFGMGSGGGALKDIYHEGVAAIKEAEKYWAKENKHLTKELKDFMNGPGVSSDADTFGIILGEDWKKNPALDPDTKKLLGIL